MRVERPTPSPSLKGRERKKPTPNPSLKGRELLKVENR